MWNAKLVDCNMSAACTKRMKFLVVSVLKQCRDNITIKIFMTKGRAVTCLGKHYRTEWRQHHHHHHHHQYHRHPHDLFGWWLVWAGRLVHLGSTPPVGSTSSRLGSLAPREAHGDKPAISRRGSKVAFSGLFGDHFQTTCTILPLQIEKNMSGHL